MVKNILKHFVFIPVLAVCLFCGAGSRDVMETKESIMAFEINNVAYPVSFANFQRNSNVPIEMKSKWKPVWAKEYTEINEEIVVSPYMVYVSNGLIGVRCESEMFVYDTLGNVRYQMPLSGSAGVVFGDTALAYFLPSHQLIFQDYEFNFIGDAAVIPELDEWGYELLMKPTLDNILAVVQFSGGPMREPKKYFVYDFNRKQRVVNWFNEYDEMVNLALLSNNDKTIILIKLNEIILINAEDGQTINSFKLDIDFPLTASLDKNDNLIVLAEKTVDKKTSKSLIAYSLDGKELWSLPLNDPGDLQPPACDNDGRIYIIDGLQLLCLKEGEIDWTAILKPAERNWLTITADNFAVVINGSLLALFDPNGEKIFERLITKTDEKFYAPPALDKEGHIFVAGQKALYCFE